MKKIFLLASLSLLLAACQTSQETASLECSPAVARAEITYHHPVTRSEEGLPIGNGRTGTLLWTTPSALHAQINRVDVFGVDRSTTSFPERHTDYCGGCAFVDVDVGGDAFTGAEFRQTLSLLNGVATTEGNDITIRALAWNEQDVIALQVDDERPTPSPIQIKLHMLRPPVVKTFAHTATSATQIIDKRIALTQAFQEGSFYCGSSVVAGIQGRDAAAQADGDREIRLTVPPGRGKFTIYLSSAASLQQNAPSPTAIATTQIDAAQRKGIAALTQSNAHWWSDFWGKFNLELHSTDGIADKVEQDFYTYLYLMASTSRGQYPTKFNGMLWITGGDTRNWGTQYWGANQSCLYNNALFAANHAELLNPMFAMYSEMLPSLETAAHQQWGSEGAFIPETVAFNGLAPLPDDIAAEMRALYLLKKPWSEMSPEFRAYAGKRLAYSSRWNWIGPGKWVDGQWTFEQRSPSPYGPVTHIFSRGAKIAYQYWVEYEYTHDDRWLRVRAYPMLKDVAEFYRHYPNMTRDADGKWHIHYVNSNEGIWGAQDTDEEIASLRGILPVAIKAADILHTDPGLRDAWKELLANLAPLPLSNNPGALANDHPLVEDTSRQSPAQRQRANASRAAGPVVWVRGLNPDIKGNVMSPPDGNTMPEWFFDLCGLESDPTMRAIANATFDGQSSRRWREPETQPATQPAATQPAIATAAATPRRAGYRGVGVLSKRPLAAAILGRGQDVKRLIPDEMLSAEVPVLANRMDLREGPQTTSAQRMGNASDALQTALCQSAPASPAADPIIHVFPAWNAEWDARFTLLQRGGFLVSSEIHNGTIPSVRIRSQLGGTCRIRNPWPDAPVTLTLNGKNQPDRVTDLLILDTHVGDELVLTRDH